MTVLSCHYIRLWHSDKARVVRCFLSRYIVIRLTYWTYPEPSSWALGWGWVHMEEEAPALDWTLLLEGVAGGLGGHGLCGGQTKTQSIKRGWVWTAGLAGTEEKGTHSVCVLILWVVQECNRHIIPNWHSRWHNRTSSYSSVQQEGKYIHLKDLFRAEETFCQKLPVPSFSLCLQNLRWLIRNHSVWSGERYCSGHLSLKFHVFIHIATIYLLLFNRINSWKYFF